MRTIAETRGTKQQQDGTLMCVLFPSLPGPIFQQWQNTTFLFVFLLGPVLYCCGAGVISPTGSVYICVCVCMAI